MRPMFEMFILGFALAAIIGHLWVEDVRHTLRAERSDFAELQRICSEAAIKAKYGVEQSGVINTPLHSANPDCVEFVGNPMLEKFNCPRNKVKNK